MIKVFGGGPAYHFTHFHQNLRKRQENLKACSFSSIGILQENVRKPKIYYRIEIFSFKEYGSFDAKNVKLLNNFKLCRSTIIQ